MKKAEFIMDNIVKGLCDEKNMVLAEINGFYFSARDVSLPDEKGNCEIFRIAVIPHKAELIVE